MKKLLIIMLAVILTTPALVHAESFGPQYDKMISIFQGEAEPSAMDAIWESKSFFKVGVINNGKNQDNYANHVCEILHNEDFRGKGIEVMVVDIEKLAFENKLVTLGKATCE